MKELLTFISSFHLFAYLFGDGERYCITVSPCRDINYSEEWRSLPRRFTSTTPVQWFVVVV